MVTLKNKNFTFKFLKLVWYNQGCHLTLKPGRTWKNLEFDNKGKKKKPDKNLEFEKF